MKNVLISMYNQYGLFEKYPQDTYKYYISWNDSKVFISIMNYNSEVIRKSISTNERYIKWLNRNAQNLSVLFNQANWFTQEDTHTDKYISELKYHIGDTRLRDMLDNL